MIFSLFYRHNSFCTVQCILGQQLLFKRKHRSVVPIHGHVHRKLRSLTWGLSDGKKVQVCDYVVFESSTTFQGRKEWICKGSICRQVSGSSKCLFTCICQILLPLNPFATTVYAWSSFYPSLRFTLSLQSAFYTQSAFYPWTAVCSLQSAVCVLHWPIAKSSNPYAFSFANNKGGWSESKGLDKSVDKIPIK